MTLTSGDHMDEILRFMEEQNIPATRENYLEVAYMGTPPDELSAEEEAELPEQFQLEPPKTFE